MSDFVQGYGVAKRPFDRRDANFFTFVNGPSLHWALAPRNKDVARFA
jgi:hypothetical protein